MRKTTHVLGTIALTETSEPKIIIRRLFMETVEQVF